MRTINHKLKDGVTITSFEGDHISNVIGISKYYYEAAMLAYIRDNVHRGVMVDVGSNIGNHSIYLAKYCAISVISFEPFNRSFELLQVNVLQNNLTNIELCNFGLSSCTDDLMMSLGSELNVGMAKISSDGTEPCKVIAFDDYYKMADMITMIKIDCEGYELNVIKGMIRTIEKHKPDLFIECQSTTDYEDVSRILHPLGYTPVRKFNSTPTYLFKHG